MTWRADQISIIMDGVDGSTVLAKIDTPAGQLEILCEVALADRQLHIRNAHVHGLRGGDLGRAGLNVIGAAVLENLDADALFVEGAARTTGANPGRRPKAFRYNRRR